uniref:hypothetical protein n=1 Tax=Rhodococcus oryzae TaxID=2571143 RepID=UPI00145F2988|nr:hypothetical protein [Rhodococcus oryzae]
MRQTTMTRTIIASAAAVAAIALAGVGAVSIASHTDPGTATSVNSPVGPGGAVVPGSDTSGATGGGVGQGAVVAPVDAATVPGLVGPMGADPVGPVGQNPSGPAGPKPGGQVADPVVPPPAGPVDPGPVVDPVEPGPVGPVSDPVVRDHRGDGVDPNPPGGVIVGPSDGSGPIVRDHRDQSGPIVRDHR